MRKSDAGFRSFTMQRKRLLLPLVCFLALLTLQDSTLAQRRGRTRLAINDLAEVDGDFQYMGEFQGGLQPADGTSQTIGLQVVALGDGAFSAMHYVGGLPGSGWNKVDREKLQGELQDSSVMLTGSTTTFRVRQERAEAYDEAGNLLGSVPKVIRRSPMLGMPAPDQAEILFDGRDTNAFKDGRMTNDQLLIEGTELVNTYRDFTLHVEFRLPYMPHARGQGRANSGLYLQSSYEVQVLDSFGLEGVENECGALYRYRRPDQNMCFPPLTWQTYDITFRSPRFDGAGNKVCNARITVLHNGVLIHDDFDVERKTGAGKPESPTRWPIKFQDHSNPVRFRNVWLLDLCPDWR